MDNARLQILNLATGSVNTVFMPVGTQATVKEFTWDLSEVIQASIILGNTYHLNLRPGIEVIGEAGGLANFFMNWNQPVPIVEAFRFLVWQSLEN